MKFYNRPRTYFVAAVLVILAFAAYRFLTVYDAVSKLTDVAVTLGGESASSPFMQTLRLMVERDSLSNYVVAIAISLTLAVIGLWFRLRPTLQPQ